MRLLAARWIGLFLLGCPLLGQDLPKFPKVMPGVVNIPHLAQQPTKVVKPVYPPEELQRWIQTTVVLDAILDTSGNVESLGCDATCSDARPDFIQSAATAVRQWRWNPVMMKGKVVRVRTRVSVDFLLDDASPPISVCNVFHDPQHFNGLVVNVFGTVERVAGVNVLASNDCEGNLVIAMNGDATPPDKDAKYALFEQALASGPAPAALRGLIHDDSGPGRLAGERIALQRVLQCSPRISSH